MRKKTLEQQTQELLKVNNVKPVKVLTKQERINDAATRFKEGHITTLELGKALSLNDQQIRFAELYTTSDYYGKKLEVVALVYGYDIEDKHQRPKALAQARILTTHMGVCELIAILQNVGGLSKEDVMSQINFMIKQNDNLPVKLAASRTWLDVHGYSKSYSEVTVKVQRDFSNLTEEQLEQYIHLEELTYLNRSKLDTTGIEDAEVID